MRGQPMVIGGTKKSLKTSIMLDAAISIATGRRPLNRFDVPEKLRVAVFSGESGEFTIGETADRIAKSILVSIDDCDVLWGFQLPKLSEIESLDDLAELLKAKSIRVVFIDPVYLCLLSGQPQLQASNMFHVGPLLMQLTRSCLDVGATPILVHHTTKHVGSNRGAAVGEPLDLEDLAYAGFAEFARQWWLINRRCKFVPGSGEHLLWLNVGGSVGYSGCWGVDVNEGILRDDFRGREWWPTAKNMSDVLEAKVAQKKLDKEGKNREQKTARHLAVIEELLRCYPEAETKTELARQCELQSRDITPILDCLSRAGFVQKANVNKPAGQGMRPYPAYVLTTNVATDLHEKLQQGQGGGLLAPITLQQLEEAGAIGGSDDPIYVPSDGG